MSKSFGQKENKKKEEWRDIKGYEGLYQVSNIGRVKSLERMGTKRNGSKFLIQERILKSLEANLKQPTATYGNILRKEIKTLFVS